MRTTHSRIECRKPRAPPPAADSRQGGGAHPGSHPVLPQPSRGGTTQDPAPDIPQSRLHCCHPGPERPGLPANLPQSGRATVHPAVSARPRYCRMACVGRGAKGVPRQRDKCVHTRMPPCPGAPRIQMAPGCNPKWQLWCRARAQSAVYLFLKSTHTGYNQTPDKRKPSATRRGATPAGSLAGLQGRCRSRALLCGLSCCPRAVPRCLLRRYTTHRVQLTSCEAADGAHAAPSAAALPLRPPLPWPAASLGPATPWHAAGPGASTCRAGASNPRAACLAPALPAPSTLEPLPC